MDMFVDQSALFHAPDSHHVEKQCSGPHGENHLNNPDPCLLQGSMVMAGSGKAVVCAVGKQTRRE